MLTVSCYAFHPLIQRFVRLWRYVQVVSDVITFALSMLCCQCSDAMPLSSSSSVETKPSIQVFEGYRRCPAEGQGSQPGHSGDPLKPEHMVIDVSPGRGDMPKTQERHQDYWQSPKTRTGTVGMMVESPREAGPSKQPLIDLSRDSVPPVIVVEQINKTVPGIHMARTHNNTGRLKDAVQSGAVNRCCT
ncbi:hypothetical protein PYW08_016218 [Mythimna loreyi]|uniref:Uncharacterized protein n=1 Tax=Mythimna loreyi TaxID=667449 RepID=A0ACC2QXF1_9NEOP|nr:hypothetical protein PYW08_016218 [Mythimna loreyi]